MLNVLDATPFAFSGLAIVLPELHRLVVRRIDDEMCDSLWHITYVSALDIRA